MEARETESAVETEIDWSNERYIYIYIYRQKERETEGEEKEEESVAR